jgi:hypothetical protein
MVYLLVKYSPNIRNYFDIDKTIKNNGVIHTGINFLFKVPILLQELNKCQQHKYTATLKNPKSVTVYFSNSRTKYISLISATMYRQVKPDRFVSDCSVVSVKKRSVPVLERTGK